MVALQETSMTIAVGVVTAPRPGPWLLGRCLDSLRETGFDEPYIFAEPGSRVRRTGRVIARPRKYGEYHNWRAGLGDLLDLEPSADGYLMVQDDIYFCRNVAAQVKSELWPSPKCGGLHIYVSARYREYPRRCLTRLSESAAPLMAGACAIVFPQPAARAILEYANRERWRGHTVETRTVPEEMEGVDTFIGVALLAMDWEIWLRNPSLAEHDALHSALGHGGPTGSRRAANFPGADADACSLFTR